MKQSDIIKEVGGIEHYRQDSDEGEITYRDVFCNSCGKWVEENKAVLIDSAVICDDCRRKNDNAV